MKAGAGDSNHYMFCKMFCKTWSRVRDLSGQDLDKAMTFGLSTETRPRIGLETETSRAHHWVRVLPRRYACIIVLINT